MKVRHLTHKEANKLKIGQVVEVEFDGATPGSHEYDYGIITEKYSSKPLSFKVLFDRRNQKDYFNRIPHSVDYTQIVNVANGSVFDVFNYDGDTRCLYTDGEIHMERRKD